MRISSKLLILNRRDLNFLKELWLCTCDDCERGTLTAYVHEQEGSKTKQ